MNHKPRPSSQRHSADRFSRAAALFVFTLAAFTLSGCAGNTRPTEGTIDFLIESAPTNLDPRIGTDAVSEHLDGLMFDSLVAHDDQMNVVPDLATSWDQPDPLTYVFHLRQGVKFHDGRAFTSADVKFTFDSILLGAIRSVKRGGSFNEITAIETPDEHTVVFRLREPYSSFLWSMARPAIGIVPQGSGKDFAQNPVGTGPFRFVSLVTDDNIVLERNPGYFGSSVSSDAVSKIQRIRFRIVPDETVRALELRKGSTDISAVNSLAPDTALTLQNQKNLVVENQPGTTIAYISMNFDDPILAHRGVRQALAYATDRDSLIEYLMRGQATPASSLLPTSHWAYDPNVRQYNYDATRAAQLLDAEGFPKRSDGTRFHLELKTSTEESTRLIAEVLAEQWKKVGVILDLRPLETGTFYSDITRGSFQLYTLRWLGVNNDPDAFDFVFNSKKMPPDGANRGHYSNPELDALFAEQRAETNREKRKAIVSRIQQIVAENEPYITLWYLNNVCVHNQRITGIKIPPSGDFDFLTQATLR